MSSWSRSRYQGSCRDDDSVSSLQAGLRAHCTVCGGMLTHTDICCWSAHFRGCCCHSIAGSISPVTRSVTCVAPATGAPLLPGPAACAARRARTGHPPSLHQHQPGRHQRSFFRSSYNLVCVCLHTDNTQLCPVCVWRLWSVWCLYGELPLPPSWHCLLSLSISRWTVWAGQQHTGN